jgi:hypothetical protein
VSNLQYARIEEDEANKPFFVSKRDSSPLDRIAKLRAAAARFRLLAESSFDPGIVAAVRAFAHDLESEAAMIEERSAA